MHEKKFKKLELFHINLPPETNPVFFSHWMANWEIEELSMKKVDFSLAAHHKYLMNHTSQNIAKVLENIKKGLSWRTPFNIPNSSIMLTIETL